MLYARPMELEGACGCGTWSVTVDTSRPLTELRPRECDCEYCQAHPAAVISEPNMVCRLSGPAGSLIVDTNGAGLASFYRCGGCGQLIAVGREIEGTLRGAVNAVLLAKREQLGETLSIQPRLLTGPQKLARWSELWGTLSIRP